MKKKSLLFRVSAVLAAATVAVLGASPAAVGATFATTASIDSLAFQSSTVESGTLTALEGSWSLPDHPSTPAGFTLDLPEGLQGRIESFPLAAPDGSPMGTCTVTAKALDCAFDSAYLQSHPLALSGDFEFWVWVSTSVSEPTQTTYDISGHTVDITVTPTATCTTDCEFAGQGNEKYGVFQSDVNDIWWTVVVQAPVEGMAVGQTVTVDDTPDPSNQELITSSRDQTFPRVEYTDQIAENETGHHVPVNWQTVDATKVEVVSPGKLSFVTEGGYFYRVLFATSATDAATAGDHVYTNNATVTIGSETAPVSGVVEHQGGGGDGAGTEVGTFSITKNVVWGEVIPLSDLAYTGEYAVTAPGGAVSSGSYSLLEGQTWTSPSFPTGSIVNLTENTPAAPGNITWASSFSSNDLTVVGGQTTSTILTNTPTLSKGVFQAHKVLTGNAADTVPTNMSFTLDYSYPAGPGFAAGAGALALSADGTVVSSPELPVGAVVSLHERAPAAIEGTTWGQPHLSATSVTIGEGATASITVTNQISREPVSAPGTTPQVPTATPQAPTGSLALTGGVGVPGTIIVAAIATIIAGAALVVVRRRRARADVEKPDRLN